MANYNDIILFNQLKSKIKSIKDIDFKNYEYDSMFLGASVFLDTVTCIINQDFVTDEEYSSLLNEGYELDTNHVFGNLYLKISWKLNKNN